MDKGTIFTKTAKGTREATGKTSALPRAMRNLLKEIDGRSTLGELDGKVRGFSGEDLDEALTELLTQGYIREFVTAAAAVAASQPAAVEEPAEDLDFTAIAQSSTGALDRAREAEAARLKLEAEQKARQEAEERARREAAEKVRQAAEEKSRKEAVEKARKEAEEKARREAEESARRQAAAEQARKEAEEKARKEAEEKARREAEERARREAEERAQAAAEQARKEAEERVRREAEEKARREAEELARKEAQERARQEAEARAREEAEEKARKEAEEKARKEAEEKARREAEERARREAEERAAAEQARREAEEKSRREAEERARRETEERARQAAAEKARKEAEDKARREAEERAAADLARKAAEEQARREAEEKSRREAEERARQEAEEKARKEAEEQARKEAEERSRREAEERVRREAEERARQESAERERREAQEKARQEASEKERQAAAAKARKEDEERARREAEDMARKEAEEKARKDAEERARRDAEQSERAAAEELARIEAEEREREAELQRVESPPQADETTYVAGPSERRTIRWGRLIFLLALLVTVTGLIAVHLVSFSSRVTAYERAATEKLQRPVRIGSVHFVLFPTPRWRLADVTVGEDGEAKIARIDAYSGWSGLFAGGAEFQILALDNVHLKESVLRPLLFGKAGTGELHASRITATNLQIDSPAMALPAIQVRADIDPDGSWRHLVVESMDKSVSADIQPDAGQLKMEISADALQLPNGGPTLKDFSAKGSATPDAMTLSEIETRSFDGFINGTATLRWGDAWGLEASVNGRDMAIGAFLPGLADGRVAVRATLQGRAERPDQLLAKPRYAGSLTAKDGNVLAVDMVRGAVAPDAKTGFTELTGEFSGDGDRLRLSQLRLKAGVLSGAGNVEIDSNKSLRGSFSADQKSPAGQAHYGFTISGSVAQPRYSR